MQSVEYVIKHSSSKFYSNELRPSSSSLFLFCLELSSPVQTTTTMATSCTCKLGYSVSVHNHLAQNCRGDIDPVIERTNTSQPSIARPVT